MWVKFKIWWQDGLYQYCPGKVVLLPMEIAKRYCQTGKAIPCEAPKWAISEVAVKKKHIPGPKPKLKMLSFPSKQQASYNELANEVIDED
jgi:hypothetical protein